MILFTAAPYGYGPTSKVLCIAEELAEKHEIVYVGMQPGISLVSNAGFAEVIEIADRDNWSSEALRVLERSELLISALEYRALPLAARHGIPSVFLDTLLWLRDMPPAHVELAQVYIAQRFPHPGSGAEGRLRANLQSVGPILPGRFDQPLGQRVNGESPRVLVCVGGLRSPAMALRADLNYIELVLHLLESGLPPGMQVQLALPRYLQTVMPIALAKTDLIVSFPTQSEFYELLEVSDILVTTPGLEVVYEAIAASVPIVFLPPYNATQLLQARTYSSLGIALHKIEPVWERTWDTCFFGLEANMLNELTRQVQALNADLLSDRNQIRQLGCSLGECFRVALATPEILKLTARAAHQLLDALGRNGRERATNTIASVLSATAF